MAGSSWNTKILVTGAAGFIGYHLCDRLLREGHEVLGIDDLNPYYDVRLKETRLHRLQTHDLFDFAQVDISDADLVSALFDGFGPRIVVNLAAQAGVRYSLENPSAYIRSNVVGFANILEACRQAHVDHLLYASSSSVYGGNAKIPFEEGDRVDHPVSLYAATKRSNELMADCYAHLYSLPVTGLRFFTVYGPYGRPDMAYFGFTDRYFSNRAIEVFTAGDKSEEMSRDFTFIDDVVESALRLIPLAPSGSEPHAIYNVGGSEPVKLTEFISTLEDALSLAMKRPVLFDKVFEGPKPGDVHRTYASADRLERVIGFRPRTSLRDGLKRFADWYVQYNQLIDPLDSTLNCGESSTDG